MNDVEGKRSLESLQNKKIEEKKEERRTDVVAEVKAKDEREEKVD